MKPSWLDIFRAPPAMYRPMPQWSWNGDLTEVRITEQLEQFAAQGCGGLFTHARPGHITGYMSERWLDLWGFALDEAARRGLEFHIYDEFMCPAGHASGLVLSERPHLAQKELVLIVDTGLARPLSGERLAHFRLAPDAPTPFPITPEAARDASPTQPTLSVTLRALDASPGWGGFPGPDLCKRETLNTFIATTHDRYAERFADDFGARAADQPGGVRFMFSDEPQIFGKGGLPFSRDLARAFYHDHGYDLAEHLGDLCFPPDDEGDNNEAYATRFDYWWTVNKLFNENFMRPLSEWCAEHNLLLTGHLMEHEWPSPRSHPSAMASLRWMHAPGSDLLGFQFTPTTPANNGIYLLNLLELRSVKQQLGRAWMLVETCGGGGYDKAFETFKPLEDLVLAFGFNVIDPHLTHESLAGMRKYDWPQTLSDHSPWWRYYRPHADHVARANAALSQGTETHRTLVLHPTTSGWLHYTAPAFQLKDNPCAQASAEKLHAIRQSQIDLLLHLYGEQIDFDLGDELILEDLGHVEGGKLVVGECAYDVVVLPSTMENWTEATLHLMRAYLDAGGQIFALRPPPTLVNGRQSDDPTKLREAHPASWQSFETLVDLSSALRHAVPPYITGPQGDPLPEALCWRRVDLESNEGALYFFCNPWSAPLTTDVRIEGGGALVALDTTTGETMPCPAQVSEGTLTAHLRLPPRGHVLWWHRPQAKPTRAVTPQAQRYLIPLDLVAITRQAPNLLMLDYCDLTVAGRSLEGVHVIQADTANWRWQGFEQNPWKQARQFKRTASERWIRPDSGFTVRYHFTLDSRVPPANLASLRAGVERPWLYTVCLNGQTLDVDNAPSWFDEHARALDISTYVQPGENTLTLEARPFNTLCEIMPVYLSGDFALEPAARSFNIIPAKPLSLGDWTQQGLPFYPASVRYRFAFALTEAHERLRLQLGDWAGSVVGVELDDAEVGAIMHPPYTLNVAHTVPAGKHTLTLNVVGNMRNMMGPHHTEGLPGAWTWEASPSAQPPGVQYHTCSSGLQDTPKLWST